MYLVFRNDNASRLGMPLPKGIVRVYKRVREATVRYKVRSRFQPAARVPPDPAESAVESKRGKFRPNRDKAESTGSTRMESINRWMEQRPGPGAAWPRLEEPRNPATPRRTCPRRGR